MLQSGVEEKDPFHVVLMDVRGSADEERAFAGRIHEELGERGPFMAALTPIEADDVIRQDPDVDAVLPQPVRRVQLYDTLVHARHELREAASGIAAVPDTSARDAQGFTPPRVLLVEDNPLNQRLGQEMLTVLGYEAAVASNGRICLDMLQQNPYDLVLMDCQMPEMDGYAATHAIRQREDNTGARKIPIVALTANAMHGDRERCLESGMDDYIAKPFTLQTLKDILAHWLPRAAR
jgi:CheY-like chemotaxis protein